MTQVGFSMWNLETEGSTVPLVQRSSIPFSVKLSGTCISPLRQVGPVRGFNATTERRREIDKSYIHFSSFRPKHQSGSGSDGDGDGDGDIAANNNGSMILITPTRTVS